jgi:hypothetical protein
VPKSVSLNTDSSVRSLTCMRTSFNPNKCHSGPRRGTAIY